MEHERHLHWCTVGGASDGEVGGGVRASKGDPGSSDDESGGGEGSTEEAESLGG